jgi:hypothetical protein
MQGFQSEKAGKVMTADRHDWELWKSYFKQSSPVNMKPTSFSYI